jgi:hypothetical protein
VWSLSLFSYSEFSDFALSRYSITTLVLLLVSLLFFVFPVTGSNWICSKHNTARTSPSKVSRSPVDHSTLPSAPYQAPTQGPRSLRVLMVQVDTAAVLIEDLNSASSIGRGEIAAEVRTDFRRSSTIVEGSNAAFRNRRSMCVTIEASRERSAKESNERKNCLHMVFKPQKFPNGNAAHGGTSLFHPALLLKGRDGVQHY